MRKMLAVMFATGLGFSMVQPAVLAADNIVEIEEVEEAKEVIGVNSLSMDTVVELGLKRNSVLLLLDYQMGILDNQKNQMELDRTIRKVIWKRPFKKEEICEINVMALMR